MPTVYMKRRSAATEVADDVAVETLVGMSTGIEAEEEDAARAHAARLDRRAGKVVTSPAVLHEAAASRPGTIEDDAALAHPPIRESALHQREPRMKGHAMTGVARFAKCCPEPRFDLHAEAVG